MGYSLAGLAVIAAGGMLTGKGPAGKLKPAPSVLAPPPQMPDQLLINQAAKKEAALSIGRTGRASTILTSGSDVAASDKLGP